MNKQLLILFFISIVSVGCTTNTVPAIELYTLNSSCDLDGVDSKKSKSTKVLKVSTPKSIAVIKSRHILYQDREFSLNPYANSRWSDTPNKMLGSLILSCINKNSKFKAALPSYSKGKGDFLLESTLLDFHHHINTDGSSEGRMRIEFYIINPKNGNVIATNELSSNVSSESLNTKGGVQALNSAANNISLNLSRWLLSIDALGIQ